MKTVPTSFGTYTLVTPEEAKDMLSQGNLALLDVRRPDEYKEKHIEGARLVPNESIGGSLIPDLPLKKTILVYCKSGKRSEIATKKLLSLGYTTVYNMEGGIEAWPYDTVSGDEA